MKSFNSYCAFLSIFTFLLLLPEGTQTFTFTVTVRPLLSAENLFPCFICEDQRKLAESGDGLTDFSDSNEDLSLYDIEFELTAINDTVWWKPVFNISLLKDKSEQLWNELKNLTVTIAEADTQVEHMKEDLKKYHEERDVNKKKALEHWNRLAFLRHKLHKIEEGLLGKNMYENSGSLIAGIDKCRAMANKIAKRLRTVYEYYYVSDMLATDVSLNFVSISLEKTRILGENLAKRAKKCFWFICF